MNSIGSTLNSINSSLLGEIDSYLSTQQTSGSTSTIASNDTPFDRVDFSQAAQLFKTLQKLRSTDPTGFKKVLTDAAKKLMSSDSSNAQDLLAALLKNLHADSSDRNAASLPASIFSNNS